MTTDEEIDLAAKVIIDLLKLGAEVFPALGPALPTLTVFIRWEAFKLKAGIADGSIVPDGQGGLVPSSNSRYNAKNGKFL